MRRTRHRRRFHTDRIVASRRARYLRETPGWVIEMGDRDRDWFAARTAYGVLADRDPWDCGRHCEWCHWGKFNEPRRAREKRAWRYDWSV